MVIATKEQVAAATKALQDFVDQNCEKPCVVEERPMSAPRLDELMKQTLSINVGELLCDAARRELQENVEESSKEF